MLSAAVFVVISERNRDCIHTDDRVPRVLTRTDMIQEKDYESFREDYELVEVIGTGGFAEIWKVRHKVTGMIRAAKIVKLSTENEYRVFRNEVEVLKKLDSPYNVRIVASYLSRDRSRPEERWNSRLGVIIYHYIKGSDLLDTINQRIAAKKKFSEPEIVSITKQILKALCYVHNCGFLHRDIKPENFIVEMDDSPCGFNLKIIDFGLSRASTVYTQSNERLSGTWFYSAPETVSNSYTDKSDVWSVGVIITMLVSQGTALIGRSTSMGMAGIKRVRDPDFISSEIEKLKHRDISPDMIKLLKRILDPKVSSRISPEDALDDVALVSSSAHNYPKTDALNRWKRSRSDQASLPLFAKYMRRLFVHEIDDSELSRLRYLFRILDTKARGYVTITGIVDGSEERYGYEEFLSTGLDAENVRDRWDVFFKYISGGKNILTLDGLCELFPGLSQDVVKDMMQSCRPEESLDPQFVMSRDDFERCMNTKIS